MDIAEFFLTLRIIPTSFECPYPQEEAGSNELGDLKW